MVSSAPVSTSWTLRDRIETTFGTVAVDVIGTGPPVVLTHGTPSWSFLWRQVGPRLAEDHTVHLWDLIGYGDSEPAAGVTPSVAVHAATLAELVEHWGLSGHDRVVFAGHDIGGGAVLRAHLLHGVDARGLVLLDAAVLTPWVTPVAAHMQAHLEAYRSMPNSLFGEVVAAHLSTATVAGMPGAVRRAYLDRYDGDDGQQRWLDQVAGFTDDDTRQVVDGLDRIIVPVHLIWGEHDRWLPLDTARALHAAIPDAQLTVIPAAGHFLTEDAPDATTTAIHTAVSRTLTDVRPRS
jgi:pimeloyl-ACP methyl ester carboxylesterase